MNRPQCFTKEEVEAAVLKAADDTLVWATRVVGFREDVRAGMCLGAGFTAGRLLMILERGPSESESDAGGTG